MANFPECGMYVQEINFCLIISLLPLCDRIRNPIYFIVLSADGLQKQRAL